MSVHGSVRARAGRGARQFARPEAAVGARSACGRGQQTSASFSSLPTTIRVKLRITTHISSLFYHFLTCSLDSSRHSVTLRILGSMIRAINYPLFNIINYIC